MNLHIITGASRGLGEALGQYFSQRGDLVVDISRSGRHQTKTFKTYPADLSDTSPKGPLIERIFKDFPLSQFHLISLTNNAGRVEPVKFFEHLDEPEILKNLMVNLYSPLALTTAFLKATHQHQGPRVITNVSTGVAKKPKSHWGPYSASKAGLESFSEVLCQELQNQKNTRLINFEPGIVDTEMQASIRHTPKEDFPERERFVNFKKDGQLLAPEFVAQHLGALILQEKGPQKSFVSIHDLKS